jgi:hypothetical protein
MSSGCSGRSESQPEPISHMPNWLKAALRSNRPLMMYVISPEMIRRSRNWRPNSSKKRAVCHVNAGLYRSLGHAVLRMAHRWRGIISRY